jgi:hypothetical protein
MGQLIVTEFVTLDGVAQAPGRPDEDRDGGFAYGGWQAPLADQEAGGVIFEAPCTWSTSPPACPRTEIWPSRNERTL